MSGKIYRGILGLNGERRIDVVEYDPTNGSERVRPLKHGCTGRSGDRPCHSPDGFEWGYTGSGPHEAALALLADATGNPDTAMSYYGPFCMEVVHNLNRFVGSTGVDEVEWSMDASEALDWLEDWTLRQARLGFAHSKSPLSGRGR